MYQPIDFAPQSAEQITLRRIFLEYIQVRKIKSSTAIDYRKRLEVVADWLDKPVSVIDKHMVIERFHEISQRSASTANLVFKVLRTLMNYAKERYDLPSNPVAILSAIRAWNKLEKRRSFIKPEQMEAWFTAVRGYSNSTVRDYLLFLIFTGLRRNEAARLRWDDVDLKHRTISIPSNKSGREHGLPITDFVLEMLTLRWANRESEWVFPGKVTGQPLSNCNKSYERIAKRCGIRFCPHDLRRTFSTMAQIAGCEKEMIRKILNHKDQDITGDYIIYWMDRFKEPMQRTEHCILQWAGLE